MAKIEDVIQRELIRWLKDDYPDWKVFATRNEDSRNRSKEIEVGIPDLILRKNIGGVRHFIYFEVKTKKGKLNPNQIKWRDDQDFCSNEKYGVGYGLTESKEILKRLML
jgi:hypothetical protein